MNRLVALLSLEALVLGSSAGDGVRRSDESTCSSATAILSLEALVSGTSADDGTFHLMLKLSSTQQLFITID